MTAEADDGGAVPFALAGEAGTAAVLAVLVHVPAAEVGVPTELWPGGKVMNAREDVFGVDPARDLGWRAVVPWPGLLQWTTWRRGVLIEHRAIDGVEVPDTPPPTPPAAPPAPAPGDAP